MSEDGNRGKEELGFVKGRVEDRGPLERFTQTLEGVGERNSRSFSEKSSIEVNHPEETLKSRFIRRRRKIPNGGGMLGKRMEAGTGEVMAKELGLRDSKLTFAHANCQALGPAQLQDVSEMLNMRGKVRAEDKNIININKRVGQIT